MSECMGHEQIKRIADEIDQKIQNSFAAFTGSTVSVTPTEPPKALTLNGLLETLLNVRTGKTWIVRDHILDDGNVYRISPGEFVSDETWACHPNSAKRLLATLNSL